jgi:hypothetical protein
MKANELRIGSIVKSLVNDEDFSIVEEIGHRASLGYYVSLNNQHSGVWLEHKERDLILGIPLTEEWLLKFGFEKSQEQWYTIKYFTDCNLATEQMAITYNLSSNRCAVFDAIEETDIVNILSYPIYTSKKVLYVHELQNIYFALTKKELTMK